jgi:predicted SAM-dependent methyltransferase
MKQQLLRLPGARPAVEAVLSRWDRRRELRGVERRRAAWERRDRQTLQALVGRTDLRLNVGASGSTLEGWLSIDIRPDETCFGMDAAEPWPFETASAEAVNSEHFIEHLTLAEAREYLAEAYRVLRPGGLIRTTTPNLHGICELYLGGDGCALEVHRAHGYDATTLADMVNNYFYSWEHRHIYDFESLGGLLREAGFVDVAQASFSESGHATLRAIDRHDPEGLGSTVLCVDAVKPG